GDMPLFSSPTIADEFLYIGSYDDHIYCLNVTNGDQIWKFKTNDNVISAPAVVDGYVYVGSWDESLYCLKAGPSDGVDEGVSDPPGSTYDLIWKYTTNGDIRCSPAVADDLIYVGSYDGTLYCLYSANGSLKWKFQIVDDWVFSSPTVSDGKVFFGMFWDKKIYCFDAISGDQIWNQTIQKLIGSSPSVYNNRLYIGSHFGPTGNISCLDTTTGQVIWEFPTGYWVYSSPTIADDKIYIGSCDNKIYCLNAENGYQIWNYSTGDQIWSSPAIANGLLVIGSDDGNVYAFNDTRSSPKIPNNPSPAPQVSDDNIDTILSRTKGNPDFNDIAPYEVFFGTTKP
ncbi:MAG: PQQ-binding-like beta-propeller repeat protein, partial [Euryarchaeota archaeon]|nr:PQQ-binding-like beta-propeller repeat protein [Euryarchaeota archaeon]